MEGSNSKEKEARNPSPGGDRKADQRGGVEATHKGPPVYSKKALLLHIPSMISVMSYTERTLRRRG